MNKVDVVRIYAERSGGSPREGLWCRAVARSHRVNASPFPPVRLRLSCDNNKKSRFDFKVMSNIVLIIQLSRRHESGDARQPFAGRQAIQAATVPHRLSVET